jgi:hypothetical protein
MFSILVWNGLINFCLILYRCLMMQRCDGKQGCTNQIGMKKGEKAGSLSLLNISKRFADNRIREELYFFKKNAKLIAIGG